MLIDPEVPAIDQDRLLFEYYKFFNQPDKEGKVRIQKNEEIIISIKGGTNQMQTALRVQAIASDIQKQIFLEPRLVVKKLLQGEPSDCKRVCYWQYMRTQKYATVKLLLNQRWDFAGAKVILQEWQETLKYLKGKVPDSEVEIRNEEEIINHIISQLKYGVDCLNFDRYQSTSTIKCWLNLYTQCRIYWQLDEIANFLYRLGTFYEEVLQELIRKLGGDKYLRNDNQDNKWLYERGCNDKPAYEFCEEYKRIEPELNKYNIRLINYEILVPSDFVESRNSPFSQLQDKSEPLAHCDTTKPN